jgi:PAS domain S-box-containing protein
MSKTMEKASASTEVPEFLQGGGEMGQRIREYDWSKTSLGPVHTWPQSLRTCIRIMLTSRQPIWIGWGKELIKFYNDPYKAIVKGKHPWALGTPVSIVWKDIWDDIDPLLRLVMEKDQGTYVESQLLIMERNGYPEETYYTFSYTPIPGDDGRTAGVFCANTDDTDKIISERQLRTLTQLGKRLSECRTADEVVSRTIETLKENPQDFPFALFRLIRDRKAHLVSHTELGESSKLVVPVLDLDSSHPLAMSINQALEGRQMQMVENIRNKVGLFPSGFWKASPDKAIVMPIMQSTTKEIYGSLTLGLNPYRLFDEQYSGFFSLVGDQVATAFADVHILEEERKRSEALAEIDRAKTVFFSNISHEFRTPLTLLLGPIEDFLEEPGLTEDQRIRMNVLYRNTLRMQKLVNTLLDFSRLEAGRVEGRFSRVDIASLTEDLASTFRSAIEKAGMKLVIEKGRINNDVFVDRDMWEKIILNLVSNAFKYSREGTITVSIAEKDDRLVVEVRDTGIGIPSAHLEKIFERFHRIENNQGRSQEGTGIGLALVRELVRLHRGEITVNSEPGIGSTFRVSIPTGFDHLPQEKIESRSDFKSSSSLSDAFLQEALKWNTPEQALSQHLHAENGNKLRKPTVLLADDNADMREYVSRLLSDQFNVITTVDGEEAYTVIIKEKPALVITDVMMPRLDGFGLVARIREEPTVQNIPVIFLSARAGEEAKVEGLKAGADDYLVKPFPAKELIARVESNIKLATARGEAERKLQNLLRKAPIIIFTMKGDPLRMEMANDEALKVWKRTRERVIGKTLYEIFPETSGTQLEEKYYAVMQSGSRLVEQGSPYPLEVEGVTRIHYFDFVLEPLIDDEGNVEGILTVGTDVTASVLTRKKIEESESYFRRMADTAPAILWLTDTGGNCTYLSESWYETTGQTPAEALGMGWLQMTHPEDLENSSRIFLEANARQEGFEIRYRLRQKDGRYRWAVDRGRPRYDATGTFEGYIGVVFDVHTQRLAEIALEKSTEALRINEKRYREIFENTPISIWEEDFNPVRERILALKENGITDIRAFLQEHPEELNELVRKVIVKDVNQATLQLVEARSKEELKEGLQQIFMEHSTPAFISELETISRGGGHLQYETTIQTRTGKKMEVMIQINFPYDDDYSRVLVSLVDISARKLAESVLEEKVRKRTAELKELNQVLQSSNEELQQFAHVASHDLKEPLRKIRTFAGRLSMDDDNTLSEKSQTYLQKIHSASERMSTMIDGVLNHSVLNAVEQPIEVVDLKMTIHQIITDLEVPVTRKKAEIVYNELPTIEGSSVLLYQLFYNLINNSLKFSKEDMPPHIGIFSRTLDTELGAFAEITLEDNGIGFDQAYAKKIFDSFSRLNPRDMFEGTGLGLSLCRKIAIRHRGNIEARGTPGKGATFIVTLPFFQERINL